VREGVAVKAPGSCPEKLSNLSFSCLQSCSPVPPPLSTRWGLRFIPRHQYLPMIERVGGSSDGQDCDDQSRIVDQRWR
jgi:hypothetical protein